MEYTTLSIAPERLSDYIIHADETRVWVEVPPYVSSSTLYYRSISKELTGIARDVVDALASNTDRKLAIHVLRRVVYG